MKRLFNSSYTIMFLLLITFLIIFHALGFRVVYDPKLVAHWDAISAIGEWAGALVGLLIPIAVVYLEKSIGQNKREIGESNSELLQELGEFKTMYMEKLKYLSEHVDELGNISLDDEQNDHQDNEQAIKENTMLQIIRFINVSFFTTTERVAQHINLSKTDTFKLLKELVESNVISAEGKLLEENIDSITWTKNKSKPPSKTKQ